jgi:hypothetical protein
LNKRARVQEKTPVSPLLLDLLFKTSEEEYRWLPMEPALIAAFCTGGQEIGRKTI